MNEFSKCFIFVCLEKVIITIKFYLCHSCNTMEIQFLQIVWWKEYYFTPFSSMYDGCKITQKAEQKKQIDTFLRFSCDYRRFYTEN